MEIRVRYTLRLPGVHDCINKHWGFNNGGEFNIIGTCGRETGASLIGCSVQLQTTILYIARYTD